MLSVVHLSPTALSHTQRHCRHAQLGRRLLQGCIRLHKLYSIFLQPASLYASTITSYRICFNCSHSCEIQCIPMFYGRLLLQSLPTSLFASLAFWYPSLHLCIFSKLLVALVDAVVCFFFFLDVKKTSGFTLTTCGLAFQCGQCPQQHKKRPCWFVISLLLNWHNAWFEDKKDKERQLLTGTFGYHEGKPKLL